MLQIMAFFVAIPALGLTHVRCRLVQKILGLDSITISIIIFIFIGLTRLG